MRLRFTVWLLFVLCVAASGSAPKRPPTLVETAKPVWYAYSHERVASIARKNLWVRVKFEHDPKFVRYEVRGQDGSVSAPGIACATDAFPSPEEAKSAPWKSQKPKILILHFVRDGDRWGPGPVEWRDPASKT